MAQISYWYETIDNLDVKLEDMAREGNFRHLAKYILMRLNEFQKSHTQGGALQVRQVCRVAEL